MSNRTLVEINHDYCPSNDVEARDLGLRLTSYMRSGDIAFMPKGFVLVATRHHSDPEFRITGNASDREGGR
jgi:hypothetical protein